MMRALSLWQPWATAIGIGLKSIETRHWGTGVRGLLAIHAAKRWTPDERDFSADAASMFDERLRTPPLGAIIATAMLVDCRRAEDLRDKISDTERFFGNYADQRWGFIFEDVRPLPQPIPWKGSQGFFEVDSGIVFGDVAKRTEGLLL